MGRVLKFLRSSSTFPPVSRNPLLGYFVCRSEHPRKLFYLFADPAELVNIFNTTAAARALYSTLDAALRSHIDYPAVALDVAGAFSEGIQVGLVMLRSLRSNNVRPS